MSLARDIESDRSGPSATVAPTAPREEESRGFLSRWRWPMMVGGPLVILGIAAWFVLTGGRSETTDDSYVQRDKAPVSASIAGRVVEIDVRENQHVKAGQVLFKLDPSDEVASALRATAELAAARLQVTTLRAAYDQQQLVLASDLQTQSYTTREAARQKALVTAGVASRQQADEAAHNAELANAQVALARQGVATALANLGGAEKTTDAYPGVMQAQAAEQTARINLNYTTIVAPVDGIVTRVDQLQLGPTSIRRKPSFGCCRASRGWRPTSRKTSCARCASGSRRRSPSMPMGERRSPLMWRASARARAPASRRCRPRTPPATGSRSSSDCRC